MTIYQVEIERTLKATVFIETDETDTREIRDEAEQLPINDGNWEELDWDITIMGETHLESGDKCWVGGSSGFWRVAP